MLESPAQAFTLARARHESVLPSCCDEPPSDTLSPSREKRDCEDAPKQLNQRSIVRLRGVSNVGWRQPGGPVPPTQQRNAAPGAILPSINTKEMEQMPLAMRPWPMQRAAPPAVQGARRGGQASTARGLVLFQRAG
eukprot:323597-Chlamydomonas_euryale.AAC.5